jgi:hypothetical protein
MYIYNRPSRSVNQETTRRKDHFHPPTQETTALPVGLHDSRLAAPPSFGTGAGRHRYPPGMLHQLENRDKVKYIAYQGI